MKNYLISPEEAAAELLRRRRARSSLLDFTKSIEVPGRPASTDEDTWVFLPVETGIAVHHALILEVMEKVITGSLPRVMFFMPPGSAKSTYGSVVAPTWAMGKNPGTKIILASYGSDLARKHGRRARQIVKQTQYQALFDTKLSSETAAADEWALTNGSEYLACGILSGITGNRAHGIIIDDPVRGRQDADSETVQERTWNAYQEDLRTRLVPGGWEIIIQTRWSENDLSGRILPENYSGETGLIRCQDGRDWYVVCLPALCERDDDPIGRRPGDYLWPEWFSRDHFAPFQAQARTWNALFQQRPQPEQGTFFQREWFMRYKLGEQPRDLHKYGSSDYAVTDDGGDYTEHGVIGLDHQGDIWVVDWWTGQKEADVWIDAQLDLMKTHQTFCWFGESGVIKRAISPFLNRRMQEREVYGRIEWVTSIADKVTRARGFQGRAAGGKVHIPVGPVGDGIIDQLLRFPTGKNDDKIDVLSLFCLALDNAHPAILSVPPKTQLASDARIDRVENSLPIDSHEALAFHEQREESIFWDDFNRRSDRYGDDWDAPQNGGRVYSDVDGR